jgi:hypothetical protein
MHNLFTFAKKSCLFDFSLAKIDLTIIFKEKSIYFFLLSNLMIGQTEAHGSLPSLVPRVVMEVIRGEREMRLTEHSLSLHFDRFGKYRIEVSSEFSQFLRSLL